MNDMLDSIKHYAEMGLGGLMVLLFLASPFYLAWFYMDQQKTFRVMRQWRWDRGIYTKWEARRLRWSAVVRAWWGR